MSIRKFELSEEARTTWGRGITVGAVAVGLASGAALIYGAKSMATLEVDLSHNDFVTSLSGSERVDTADQPSGSGEVYDVLPTNIPSFDESLRENRFLNG